MQRIVCLVFVLVCVVSCASAPSPVQRAKQEQEQRNRIPERMQVGERPFVEQYSGTDPSEQLVALARSFSSKLDKQLFDVDTSGDTLIVVLSGDAAFASNSSELNKRVDTQLKSLADMLKDSDGLQTIVTGHTDAAGTEAYNLKLSEQRAEAVLMLLTSEGVKRNSLTAIGMGEYQPIADNEDAEGRRANRRIEILIKQNK